MSTERPEFQPIDNAPARRTWPWAVVGAALVVALLWFARRVPAPIEARPAALASVSTTTEVKPAKAEPAKPAPAPAKAPEGPTSW